MHIDGLRRRRLALLKKKKIDLRSDFARREAANAQEEDQKKEEAEIDREIGVLECARRDLI